MKVPCNYPVSWTHWTLVGKTTQKTYLGPRENQLFFYFWYFLHYRIRYDIFYERNFSTLDNVSRVWLQMLLKVLNFFSFLDYRVIINMEVLSFGERCISPIIIILQNVLRGKQENPLSWGIGNFVRGNFFIEWWKSDKE